MNAPLPDVEWRGVLNQIILELAFVRTLDDDAAQQVARRMVDRRMLTSGPEVYHRALTLAAGAERLFGPDTLPSDHEEKAVRAFCTLVLRHLDAARPWPPPRFVAFEDVDAWPWADHESFADIDVKHQQITAWVGLAPEIRLVGNVATRVLVVRQRTGELLALVGSTGPEVGDRGRTLVKVFEGDPEAALASFLQLTGCPREKVRRLGPR